MKYLLINDEAFGPLDMPSKGNTHMLLYILIAILLCITAIVVITLINKKNKTKKK